MIYILQGQILLLGILLNTHKENNLESIEELPLLLLNVMEYIVTTLLCRKQIRQINFV